MTSPYEFPTTHRSHSEVDVLVVGAGPAGLTTAITAVRNGARVLLVERHPGTSIFPRATGVHLRTMELFRAWGLHREVRTIDLGIRPLRSESATLCELTPPLPIGYPADPRRVLAVSPVLPACCPQDDLEPVLLDHLRKLGAEVRFGRELVNLVDDGDGITATLRDRATGAAASVRARYAVGADGTRSSVRRALGIPLDRLGEIGEYVNTLFTASLDGLLGDRRFGLYFIQHPDAAGVIVRLGHDRWGYLRQWYPERGESPADFTPQRCVDLIRTAVGHPAVAVRLLARLPFTMAAEVARTFRVGNGFLVGDAAHRMTPVGGLGMNTAIQAAHNLGWKLAWVTRGWADDTLLDSYEAERRAPAEHNARRSLQTDAPPPADGWIADLDRRYASAVIAPGLPRGDGVAPGQRAPHAWVSVDGRRHSLLDLFDGRLTLLVGPEAQGWRAATAAAAVPVQVLGIGTELACDTDRLARRYGIGHGGAVLIRPDGYIAWCCASAADPDVQLQAALDLALGRAVDPLRAPETVGAAVGPSPRAA